MFLFCLVLFVYFRICLLFVEGAVVPAMQIWQAKPQEIACAAWAFAIVGHADAGLLSAVARAAERQVANFKVQIPGGSRKPLGFTLLWGAHRRVHKIWISIRVSPKECTGILQRL